MRGQSHRSCFGHLHVRFPYRFAPVTSKQLLALQDEAGASDAFDRAIDIHISRLRAKLEAEPRKPRHLVTVRGLG